MTTPRKDEKNNQPAPVTNTGRQGWGARTRMVDDKREALKQLLGKYPTQRDLCKLLGISPKILGKCIQKIEGRTAAEEKQGARKNLFDQKLFKGLSVIYFSGVHDGTLSGMDAANFVHFMLEMLMQVPEYHKIMRTRIPLILKD
jgi:hypothetical protein